MLYFLIVLRIKYDRLIQQFHFSWKMSLYPISGCGLPSKPRAAEPSMFEIFSWAGQNELAESRFEQHQIRTIIPTQRCCNCTQVNKNVLAATNYCSCCKDNKDLISQPVPTKTIVEEIYKEHKPTLRNASLEKPETKTITFVQDNDQNRFSKSKIQPKQIKNYLYSYEPVCLRASRAKSTTVVKKQTRKQQKATKKQEPQLDQKTIQQRKQKLKQFEIFTRVLPNSSFTTYYGKPAFEAYGRGTSCNNLKSFNVMPHKGDNHPKHLQSHYTALIKARNMKSKSHLPRKPVDQVLPEGLRDEQYQQDARNFQLPLEKPDLIKSNRFAKIVHETGKKAGPPVVSRNRAQQIKKNKTEIKQTTKQLKRPKTSKQPKKVNDGLKYLNNRQNLIDLLEQKKLKASQLAYKVTQCYPLQLDVSQLQKSAVSKQNWDQLKPAGKASRRGDLVSDLIQSNVVLQTAN